ncbi:MAG TPA: hypothetical protein VHB46_06435 [Burkholderiales bacterium]|nr:hypothetical protein [Burkholderiales bacterium]
MQEAIEHEVERRERFIAYVKQAQNADPAQGPVEEIEARSRLRFWLDHLSPEKRVARSTSRRLR